MKTIINHLSIIAVILIIINGCDNRKMYDKNSLTDQIITKQVKDTVIISNSASFQVIVLAQNLEQNKFTFNTKEIDSIYQTNYWLKVKNDTIVEKLKRLDKSIYKFENGRQVYLATYQNDGDLFESQRQYFDNQGLLLAQHKTNSALNLIEEKNTYSKDGVVIGKTHMNGKGKMVATSTIDYVAQENKYIETTNWFISETTSRTTKEFDNLGNTTRELIYEALMNHDLSDSTEQVFEYQYGDNGKLTVKRQYNTWGMSANYLDALYSTTTYSYDKFGNEIYSKEIMANGSVSFEYHTTYQYDTKNNWTEKSSSKNNQPESRLKRTLYYRD
ncbi:MAG: hypothetical protein OCD76_11530 [Reichenbachiella sp.]